MHIAPEDLREQAERGHALLDPGPAAVVDPDDRAPVLQREVHHLDDLLAVDLAQRPAEDREVLRVDTDRPSVDGAVARDDTIAVGAVLLDPEVGRPVPRELVQLDERALVQQQIDALTRRQLPLRMLLFHCTGGTGMRGFFDPPLQIRQFARGGVDVCFRLGHRDAAPARPGLVLVLRVVRVWLPIRSVSAGLLTGTASLTTPRLVP